MYASMIEKRAASFRIAHLPQTACKPVTRYLSTTWPRKLGEPSTSVQQSSPAAVGDTNSPSSDEILGPESFGQPGLNTSAQSSDDMVDQIFSTHFSQPSRSEPPASKSRDNAETKWTRVFSDPSRPRYDTPAPRRLRGIHDRHLRAQGNTPHEAQKFNQLLADIARDLERSSPEASRSGSFSRFSDPFASNLGNLGSLYRAREVRSRRTGGEETEMTEELSAELDQMKEELTALSTDADVLEWAKEKVFRTIPGEDGESTHIPIYPYILAHTLRMLRDTFNNPHLALAVFQHAQTLSIESYLSGCLTGAYNELLLIRWNSFQDLAGVEQAIKEMDANGVKWDRKTKQLVERVCREVNDGLRDHQRKESWGDMPHFKVAALERRIQADMEREEIISRQKRKLSESRRRGYEAAYGAGEQYDERPESF